LYGRTSRLVLSYTPWATKLSYDAKLTF